MQQHSTSAVLDAQHAEIAERLKRCDTEDIAWVFGTISNLAARVAKLERDIEEMKPQQNYMRLEENL